MAKSLSDLSKTIRWKQLLFEFFSILAGVLVALAVDEWNNDRQIQQKAQQALMNVREELENNGKILATVGPSNLKAYEQLSQEEGAGASDSTTIMPALQLQDTAWKTMLNTGVSSAIPFSDLLRIAQLYMIIDVYKQTGNNFIEQFISARTLNAALGNDRSDDEILRSNLAALALMIGVEASLRAEIDDFLASEVIPN